jgi:TrbL/VirB6 plasmid conjugal transfer protein
MARSSPRVPALVRRAAVVVGVLAAVLGVPGAAAAAVPATHADHGAVVTVAARSPEQASAASGRQAASAPDAAGVASAASAPDATGGVCAVPGIGDIGGLLGFCSAGSSGLVGDLNNICQPSVPAPEPANSGIDSLVAPPTAGKQSSAPVTLYDQYGVAGQDWNAYDMQCSDMTSLIGNNVAGMVFDAAKALDRVTITIYQSAAGDGILSWLTSAVDRLITSLGNAIYFPYLAPVVIIGAIWLAWQGLIRKRATRTVEGTIWMVVACVAAIWLISQPSDFTGIGKGVSDGITQTLDVAFARLPAPAQSSCVPLQRTDPQVTVANFGYSAGNSIVDQNANELWTVLVCKPWLDGEFGTTTYATTAKGKQTVVNAYARQLLWSQAVAANELSTPAVIQAKQNAYVGIAASLKQNDPDVYSLFQGNQWTTRLEIAFAAIFAALIAGLLVLLIAITLIILKLGFLLLLVVGPFFLIVGTHPGFGRVVAIRWVEMLIGVLLKQAAVALVLSVLLYAYSLIMGTSDAALPWALKILMIALVTVAVFIYRKPFAHLFSAVGYGVVGSRERADASLREAGATGRRNTLDAATVGVPGFGAYRMARWGRRNPDQAARLAGQVAVAAGGGAAAAGAAASGTGGGAAAEDGRAAAAGVADGDMDDTAQSSGARAGVATRGRARTTEGADGSTRAAPPLDLPSRNGGNGHSSTGWSRGGAQGTIAGRAGDPAVGGPRSGSSGGPAGPSAGGTPAAAPAQFGGATRRPLWPAASPGSSRDGGVPRSSPGPAAPRSDAPAWPGSSPRRSGPASGVGSSGGSGGSGHAAPRGSSPPPARGGQSSGGPGVSGGAPPSAEAAKRAAGGTDPVGPFWLRPVHRKK